MSVVDIVKKKDYNTEIIYKLLQKQAAPHMDIEKFDGNPINYQHFMSIVRKAVEDRIENPRERIIRLVK